MQAISDRLEAYLNLLTLHCAEWSEWIAEQEQAVIQSDFTRLNQLIASADQLLAHVRELHQERLQILSEANAAGISATTLLEIAQTLPSWSSAVRRERMWAAQRHIEHLKRLHLAIWVLISHCERFADESMQIFGRGHVEASVYTASGQADTSGGQLLDTSA